MEGEFVIDEMVLLKAFIDHRTLSTIDLQEKGIVPPLDKHEQRALFKVIIDKFKQWQLIESIPESHPKAWKVILEKAKPEYDQLTRDIERRQLVEKYSFEHLLNEVNEHAIKLKRINLYRNMAIAAFALAAIVFLSGMGLPQMISFLRQVLHNHH